GASRLKLPGAVPAAGTIGVISNLLHANLNGTDKTVATIDGVIGVLDSSVPWLTTTGTGPLTLAAAGSQAANRVLASPDNATGQVGLRALVGRDLPATAVQTNQANSWTSGTQSFAAGSTLSAVGADHTSPIKSGTTAAKPATCTFTAGAAMEVYIATDATAGQNLYFCTATNTWTQMSGGGGNPIWSSLQNPSGAQSLSMTTFTSTWTWGNTTTNVPFTLTFGALTGSPTVSQLLLQDTTGSTDQGFIEEIKAVGTSTASGLKVTTGNSAVPIQVDCGSSSCTAIKVLNGQIAQVGSGTPVIFGNFGATPSTPGASKSGITFGTSGYIYGSYANDAYSPFARQSDIGGTWTGNTLTTLPAGVIPDLSGTYIPLSYINSASGVEGLDSNGSLAVAGLANVSLGTSLALFTAGDHGASPGTAFKITDSSTTATDTTVNFLVDSGTSSAHIPVQFKVIGVEQFQIVKQPGPQGEIVIGSAVAPTAISQSPFAKIVAMSQTANHNVLRLFQGSTVATGTMLEFNNATAAGAGWYFWKANPSSSS